MPGRKVVQLEMVAAAVGEVLGLSAQDEPRRVMWLPIIDGVLAEADIHVCPVDAPEIDGAEAATDSSGGPGINILVRDDVYDLIDDPSPRGNRPRTTIAHELGHALLHVKVMRTRNLGVSTAAMLMRRRAELPAYNDPEWQAWIFAHFLLMPRRAVVRAVTAGMPASELGHAFGVSETILNGHMRRLGVMPGRKGGLTR